jgi:hypothetical protein
MDPKELIGVLIVVSFAAAVVAAYRIRRRSQAAVLPEPPPWGSRTSWLAAFSYVCGLFAVIILLTGATFKFCLGFSEVLHIDPGGHRAMGTVAMVVLICTLVPAVGAFGFWAGARGALRESPGGLRGRALARWGLLLAMLSVSLAFSILG